MRPLQRQLFSNVTLSCGAIYHVVQVESVEQILKLTIENKIKNLFSISLCREVTQPLYDHSINGFILQRDPVCNGSHLWQQTTRTKERFSLIHVM